MIKILNKNNNLVFAVLFIVLAIFSFCFVSSSLNNVDSVAAEEAGTETPSNVSPDASDYFVQTQNGKKIYFLVMVAKTVDGPTWITRYVPNGEVVFLANDEKLVVSFATKFDEAGDNVLDENYSSSGDAKSLTITPKINGEGTDKLNGSSSNGDYYYKEVSFGELTGIEGHISYEASYLFFDGLNTLANQLDYEFYCFKDSTYQTSVKNGAISYERPKVEITNIQSSINYLSSTLADSSAIYSEHYFNFDKMVDGKPVYPQLTFDSNKLNVFVQRTYGGRVSSYNYSKSGTAISVVPQDGCVSASQEGSNVTLQFNKLGVYTISYKYKFVLNNVEYVFDSINTKVDLINVIGYQIYYSDYTSNTLKEFKNADTQADITYLSTTPSYDGATFTGLPSTLVSTNQAPVRFEFNGILDESSELYKKNTGTWTSGDDFNNESISEPGEYAINVVYKYENYKTQAGQNISQSNNIFSQWFYFSITNVTPVLDVKTCIGEDEQEVLYAGKYTNKNVIVKHPLLSPFDSPVDIVVKRYDFSTGAELSTQAVNNNANVLLQNDGRYSVTMKYGKGMKKSTQTSFCIDKQSIQDTIKAYAVQTSNISGNNVKTIDISTNMFVNNPFVVEWANKKSGAKVNTYYTLIKLKANEVKSMEPVSLPGGSTGDVWVNSDYCFDYEPTAVQKKIPYTNTVDDSIVTSSQILAEAGLYYFYLEDEAGNAARYFMIYDNTPSKFLQYKGAVGEEEYFVASSLNYVSEDVSVVWGSHKVYMVNAINNSNWNVASFEGLEGENIIFEYYQYLSVLKGVYAENFVGWDSSNNFYIKNLIKSKVLSIGDGQEISLPAGDYKYDVKYLNNSVAQESAYQFYVADSSNIFVGNQIITDKSLYSGAHRVTVSSDLSKSILLYDNDQYEPRELSQYGGTITTLLNNEAGDAKCTKNYVPTSKDIVSFAYVPEVDAQFAVESVNIEFFELIFNPNLKTYYYSPVSVSLSLIFEDWSYYVNDNSGGVVQNTRKLVQINLDSYGKTKQGKYVVTRTYKDSSRSYVTGKYDFMIREFVFFVDRNQLITVPTKETTPSGDTYIKRIGEFYKTYVLASQEDKKVLFDSFHRQSQTAVDVNKLSSMSPILSTNKLPVELIIPAYKYGYDKNGTFVSSDIGFEWNTSLGINGINPFYVIGFQITNKDGAVVASSVGTEIQRGYYTINLSNASTYYVKLFDGMGNTWYYSFSVLSIAPTFTLSGEYEKGEAQNEEFALYTDDKETNADCIRVTWSDPTDNYLAKIDKTKIYYTVQRNGNKDLRRVDQSVITVSDNGLQKSFLIDYDFKDGDILTINAQYEGEESYYLTGSFRTSRVLKIDYLAPVDTLMTLVDGSIIANADVLNSTRVIGEKYNKTKGIMDGNKLPFVTYSVNANTPIIMGNDTSEMYFKKFDEKYNANSYFESSLSTDATNTAISNLFEKTACDQVYSEQTFGELFAPYVIEGQSSYIFEIVEIDKAGNLTIYSVMYFLNESKTIISYNNEQSIIVVADVTDVDSISALNVFELIDIKSRDDDWSYFTIGEKDNTSTNKSFFRAPISSDGTMLSSTLLLDLGTSTFVDIENAFEFKNSTAYVINLSDRMNRVYKTINVKIASENRRFAVSFNRESENIQVLVAGDDLLEIREIEISKGVKNQSNEFDYTALEYSSDGGLYTIYNLAPELFDNIKVEILNNYGVAMTYYFIEGLVNIDNEVSGNNIITTSEYADYYSAQDINFRFQNVLYNVSIAVEENGGSRIIATNLANQNYFEIKNNGDKTSTLSLKAIPLSYGESDYVGGNRYYVVTLVSTIDESDSRSVTFRIYNKLPKIVLQDDYGRDRTSLFGGFSITKNAVKCIFETDENVTTSIKLPKESQFQQLNSSMRLTEPGNYEIKCEFNNELIASYSKSFIISEANFAVFEVRGARSAEDEIATKIAQTGLYQLDGKNVAHYVTNYDVINISWDSSLEINEPTRTLLLQKDGVYTYKYRIYNTNHSNQPQYIDETIVVTIIPVSSKIISSDSIKENALNTQEIVTETNYVDEVTYAWNSYYLNSANKILVTYKFNNVVVFEKVAINSITLSVAGVHTLIFEDISGNRQVFTKGINSRDYYEIHFIKSVVFTLNGASPIPYAIFNGDVIIALPSDDVTRTYYDLSAQPKIVAKHNGVAINPTKKNNSWTFNEPGYYEIYFEAKRGDLLKIEPYGFTIISPNTSRFGFEYSQFESYEVASVLRNGEDITQDLLDEGETVLHSFYSSIIDEKTGPGRYTLKIKAKRENKLIPTQEFEFSYWLNDQEIPIIISAKQGKTTTKKVSVQFNIKNVYDAVGDCVVSVDGFDDIVINGDTLSSLEQIQEIKIEEQGNYFVKVYSTNGNLLYSYRVVKKDPLNGVSITLIVIGSLLFVLLIIIFVRLRKRVRIR